MNEKCFCHLTDSKTGETYVVKDKEARERLAELQEQVGDHEGRIGALEEGSGGAKLYRHDIYIAEEVMGDSVLRFTLYNHDPSDYSASAESDYENMTYLTTLSASHFTFIPEGEIMANGYRDASAMGSAQFIIQSVFREPNRLVLRGLFPDEEGYLNYNEFDYWFFENTSYIDDRVTEVN